MTFSEIFENFDQNRNFFDNLTEIEILRNFRKFCKKSKFSENFTKIEFFFYNFSKVWIKSKFFVNCEQNWGFFLKFDQNRIVYQNLTKIEIFLNFLNFWKILTRMDIFGQNLRKISIFSKISKKFAFGPKNKKIRFW